MWLKAWIITILYTLFNVYIRKSRSRIAQRIKANDDQWNEDNAPVTNRPKYVTATYLSGTSERGKRIFRK